MSREIMQQVLRALRLVGKYTDSLTCYASTISEHEANIVDPSVQLAIAALEAELAKPEQTGIPEFPEPFTKADIEYAPHESWDDERERDWIDLQVCQRNKTQLHKYAKHLREMLGQALAQPEQEPSQPPVFIGVDVTPEGTHVTAFYRKPDAVPEMFYSEFHPLAQPEQANPIDTYERAYYEGKRAGIAESEAIKTQPEQEPVANEVQLNIIRWWPDGFANRLEHVWKDLIGFIPNYKLLDLQRLLAEFGFTMKIYEGEAPNISEPVKERISEPAENLEPVAYMHTCGSDIQINTLPAHCYGNNWTRTPLYTAPPKREWQGLTDEERVQAFVDAGLELAYMDYDADMKISKVIEAKLKEKNT